MNPRITYKWSRKLMYVANIKLGIYLSMCLYKYRTKTQKKKNIYIKWSRNNKKRKTHAKHYIKRRHMSKEHEKSNTMPKEASKDKNYAQDKLKGHTLNQTHEQVKGYELM